MGHILETGEPTLILRLFLFDDRNLTDLTEIRLSNDLLKMEVCENSIIIQHKIEIWAYTIYDQIFKKNLTKNIPKQIFPIQFSAVQFKNETLVLIAARNEHHKHHAIYVTNTLTNALMKKKLGNNEAESKFINLTEIENSKTIHKSFISNIEIIVSSSSNSEEDSILVATSTLKGSVLKHFRITEIEGKKGLGFHRMNLVVINQFRRGTIHKPLCFIKIPSNQSHIITRAYDSKFIHFFSLKNREDNRSIPLFGELWSKKKIELPNKSFSFVFCDKYESSLWLFAKNGRVYNLCYDNENSKMDEGHLAKKLDI